ERRAGGVEHGAVAVETLGVELERGEGEPCEHGAGEDVAAERALEVAAQDHGATPCRVTSRARASGSELGRMVPSATPASSMARVSASSSSNTARPCPLSSVSIMAR